MLPWWERDAPERGKAMVAASLAIDSDPSQGERQDRNIAHARMFENGPVGTLYQYGGRYFAPGYAYATRGFEFDDSANWNVLRSVILTAWSMIVRDKPRARFTTSGGDYRQKRRARRATLFTDGWAQETNLYAVTAAALRDCMVMDLGGVQLVEVDGRVKPVRILASEVRCDPFDGMLGEPRTLYRRRYIARTVLAASFGSRDAVRAAIERAPSIEIDQSAADGQVEVHEGWHLPSAPKEHDGRHIIAIDGDDGMLHDAVWEKPRYPIVFIRWDDATVGFVGQSLAAMLAPMQTGLNVLMDRVARGLHLMAVPRVWIQGQGALPKAQITNAVGSVLRSATKPEVLTWPAMHPEVYSWIERYIQMMYDLPGINRDISAGVSDPKAISGVAKRESLDVQHGRIQAYVQKWEAFHVGLFDLALDMIADIGASSYKVRAPGKSMETIEFKDIRMDRADYILSTWPVSQRPITPQGRKDYVIDMLQTGLWTLDQARAAMDDMDTEAADSLGVAAYRLLEQQFDQMLYEGVPQRPDEITPYDVALRLGAKFLALGTYEGCPPKNLDLMRRYLDELKRLVSLAQPAAPAASGPGQPPPTQPPPT